LDVSQYSRQLIKGRAGKAADRGRYREVRGARGMSLYSYSPVDKLGLGDTETHFLGTGEGLNC